MWVATVPSSGGSSTPPVPLPRLVGVTREEHLKAVYVVSSRKLGKSTVLVMLCSGPECGGAEMLAHPNAFDVGVQATAHIDRMAELAG